MRRILLLLPLLTTLYGCADTPRVARREPPRRSASAPRPPALRQCLAQLGTSGASFAALPDRSFGGGCSNVGTVRLANLRADTAQLSLSNLGPVTCTMANQFAGWARFGVDRAALQILGSRVARIETFGSYSCRTVAGTRRLSGHATANAIDVSGFVLEDGRRITILADWDGGTAEERRFLRVIHASACKRFGTTLGPQYNAAHKNHLHLEADGADFCR
ncbi:MAG: extensin family protein [Hyphomicrobiaceae bacterium]